MKRGPYKGSFLWKLQELPEEQVLEVVKTSISIREACLQLGLKLHGSMYPAFKIFLEERGISLNHFLGQASNAGIRHKGGKTAKTPDQILVNKKQVKNVCTIKKALLDIGRKYECEECKLTDTWNGKEIALQLDHKDGDNQNDAQENLRFLCPNCHSQTSTFGGRNKRNIHALMT